MDYDSTTICPVSAHDNLLVDDIVIIENNNNTNHKLVPHVIYTIISKSQKVLLILEIICP
jgi:hypothetical protein